MKVRVEAVNPGAVGAYRLRYPAEAARAAGVDIEYPTLGKRLFERRIRLVPNGQPIVDFMPGTRLDCDVLVIQRPSYVWLARLIPAFQRKGIAVVVDVDDDLAAIHHGNVAKSLEDPRIVLKACAVADLVTVSTPALIPRYGAHGRVMVLPNKVPEALLDMPHDSDGRTVGWPGWTGVHPRDLQVTRGGVADALQETGARFLTIGPEDGPHLNGNRVQAGLGLDGTPEATGLLSFEDYHLALGKLDVALCPLEDNTFNNSKSRLKVLETTARGAVALASPRPDYEAVAAEGIGWLVKDRARSWRSAVRDMLLKPELRAEVVAQGQAAIRERHTYERSGDLWATAWETALRNHRRQSRRIGLVAA